jgi:putative molybdopterin biosynthesis protein
MTDHEPLYEQIASSIRRRIIKGDVKPGDQLPPVRELTTSWGCTPGTVQRAYRELAMAGLVTSQPGQGTFVSGGAKPVSDVPLRRAALVHQAEGFLLEALLKGYTPEEIEQALRAALDRWRAECFPAPEAPADALRFAGSHDLALPLVARMYEALNPGHSLSLVFTGSLEGLVSLARGEADIAGCHLWDDATDSYNYPYARRLMPGERLVLVTLAERYLGLIVPGGNPRDIQGLRDLARPGLRLAGRQRGAGTRVWLEAVLRREEIHLSPTTVTLEQPTQSDVARAIAEGAADVGAGIEAAARAFGLDFIPLTLERYDLVMRVATLERPVVQRLIQWLRSSEARGEVEKLQGYDTRFQGEARYV